MTWSFISNSGSEVYQCPTSSLSTPWSIAFADSKSYLLHMYLSALAIILVGLGDKVSGLLSSLLPVLISLSLTGPTVRVESLGSAEPPVYDLSRVTKLLPDLALSTLS